MICSNEDGEEVHRPSKREKGETQMRSVNRDEGKIQMRLAKRDGGKTQKRTRLLQWLAKRERGKSRIGHHRGT